MYVMKAWASALSIAIALSHFCQSTPGSTHHGVLLSLSLFCTLRLPSTLFSSNSSSTLPDDAEPNTDAALELECERGASSNPKEMKSSCCSNCALEEDEGVTLLLLLDDFEFGVDWEDEEGLWAPPRARERRTADASPASGRL